MALTGEKESYDAGMVTYAVIPILPRTQLNMSWALPRLVETFRTNATHEEQTMPRCIAL